MRGLALTALALALASGGAAASGSHPGQNGRLALELGDAQVYTVAPDGSDLQLRVEVGAEPAYSPDGSELAYVAAKHGEASPLVIAPANRGRPRPLARFGTWPAWSPDGSRIAYVYAQERLVIADTTGRTLKSFRWSTLYEIYSAEWSPDGRFIAMSAMHTTGHQYCCIYVVRADGVGLRPLVQEPRGTYSGSPHWSPDGRTLAFTHHEHCRPPYCTSSWATETIGLDGRDRRVVRTDTFAGPWSPDGRYLLLKVHDEAGPRLDLYRLRDGEVTTLRNGLGDWSTSLGRVSWQPQCSLSGTPRGETLRARPTGGLVCGRGGADRLLGGPARDNLLAGAGDDTIQARRGGFDVIGCGPGHDVVFAGPRDVVGVDCERVRRA